MAGLTIVKNPFVPHDGRIVKPVCPETTVGDLVDEYMPEGMEWRVFVDGKEVTNRATIVEHGQECSICAVVAGGGSDNQKTVLRSVAMIVVVALATYVTGGATATTGAKWLASAGSFGAYAGGTAIMIGGSLLVNALLPVPTPSSNMGLFSLEESNTYGWNQSRNQLNEGLTIPVLYGTMRVTPYIISRFRSSTGGKEELNMLMLVSDGQIDAIDKSTVKANDTPVQNITDATVITREGTPNQTVIPQFQDTIFEKVINTQVVYGTPVTVQTDGNAVDTLGIGFVFPQGLFTYNQGVYSGMDVDVKLEYSVLGSGIWNPWSAIGTVAHTESETIIGDSSIEFSGAKLTATYNAGSYDINNAGNDIGINAYIKMPDTSGESCIFSIVGSNAPDSNGNYFQAGKVVLGLYVNDGVLLLRTCYIATGVVYDLATNITISDDTWTHVTVNVDTSTRVVSAYKDGALTTTYVAPYDINVDVGTMYIGSQENQTKQFIGFMDNLRISKVIRSATVPTSDYPTSSSDDFVLVMSTDADTGNTFIDQSGQSSLTYSTAQETNVTITNDSSGVYRAYYRQRGYLTPAQYEIRVTILNAPIASTSQTLRSSDMYIEYIHEFNEDDFSYPGTALLAITAVASEEIYGAEPSITCIATRSVVYQYPAEWGTGTPIERPANNPAWACYDALVNPLYGMGLDLDRVEIQDFIDWASFCTAGGYELNVYLDQGQSLFDALSTISQVGRGCIVQRGTTFGAIWDTTGTRVHLYTPGNIIADSYSMQYLDMEARANVIEITYFDENLDYDRKVVTVLDDTTTSQDVERKSSIVLYGCTSREQAGRHGRYLLNTNKYLRRVISFDADIDSIVCEIGDIIGFAHDVPRYGEGGRVVSATGNSAVLSREVTFETGKTYAMIVKDPSDNTLETQAVANPGTSTTDSITLTGTWTTTPAKDWVYSFGETNLEVKDYRVTAISRSGELRATITAVEYRAEVYSDSITIEDYEQESNLPDLTTLVLDDIYEAQPDGSYIGKIYATWRGYSTHWMYQVRDLNGVLVASGSTDRREITVGGVQEGLTYSVTVRAPYNGTELTQQVTMALTAPDVVTGLSATTLAEIVTLNWDVPPSDIPIATYQVLKGDVESTAIQVGTADKTFTTFTEPVEGTFTYWVRAVDRAGRVGTSDSVTVGVKPSGDFKVLETMEYTGSATEVNSTLDSSGDILLPADTETWEDWWDAVYPSGTATWQDWIDDGYTQYMAPSTISTLVSSVEEVFDLGGELTQGVIDVTYEVSTQYGNQSGLTVVPTISYSDDDVTYVDTSGSFQVPATAFRYVKIKLTMTRADATSVYIVNPTMKVVAKGQTEAGSDTVTVANDGKVVNLAGTFARVTGVTVTPLGDVDVNATASDITSVDFPTSFVVYLRTSGTKVTGDFAYTVTGY